MATSKKADVKQTSKVEKPKKLLKGGVDPSVGRQWKKGQSGNPAGLPPGTKHLSTHIQELLNDPEFEAWVPDVRAGIKKFKGRPIKAMLEAMAIRAMNGDVRAFDALAKYGYGQKVELTGPDGAPPIALVQIINAGQPAAGRN